MAETTAVVDSCCSFQEPQASLPQPGNSREKGGEALDPNANGSLSTGQDKAKDQPGGEEEEPNIEIVVGDDWLELQEAMNAQLARLTESLDTYVACYKHAGSKMAKEKLKSMEERIHYLAKQLTRLRGMSGNLNVKDDGVSNMFLGRRAHKRFRNLRTIVRKVVAEVRLARLLKRWQQSAQASTISHISGGSLEGFEERTTKIMGQMRAWDGVDVFEVDKDTAEPLTHVFFAIWKAREFDQLCKAPMYSVIQLIRQVEAGYKANPYHNRAHAAEVTLMSYQFWSLLSSLPEMKTYFEEVDVLVLVLASAIHDIGHPAVNNDFMVKTKTDIALRYHDTAVLENFHVATAFTLMRDTGISVLEHQLPSPPVASLRRRVVEMVLATDMAVHKDVIESLTQELENHKSKTLVDKLVVEKNIIHMSDIGHPLRPVEQHQRWTKRVNEEFFAQGDREKELGFTPMSLFDREKAAPLGKGQIGFLKFVVEPLWTPLSTLMGHKAKPPTLFYQRNMRAWQAIADTEGDTPSK